ncbi:DoxX family protein [Aurantibacter sp.]|uniref:DoxX family protein n=1 Tax=Aurantibacter sp. TaxID=2807103 RepID=UPI0035C795CA
MKTQKIIHYATKSLFTALMLFSISMYLFNNEAIRGAFIGFGYPAYLVYPLASAKLLGLIAIWQTKFKTIKEWAYAGFTFNVILAFFAHTMINDGEHLFALIGIILLVTNYITYKKLNQ